MAKSPAARRQGGPGPNGRSPPVAWAAGASCAGRWKARSCSEEASLGLGDPEEGDEEQPEKRRAAGGDGQHAPARSCTLVEDDAEQQKKDGRDVAEKARGRDVEGADHQEPEG